MIFQLRHSVPWLVWRAAWGKKDAQPIKKNMANVFLYTWVSCPFCIAAKQLLNQKGVAYEEKIIDGDDVGWSEMQERTSGATTVPQVFINDESIGGFSELRALEHSGQLDAMLDVNHAS